MNLKVVDLMTEAVVRRDLPWLQKALQAAIELELATLPPYLCGLWSLQDQASAAATRIKTVVLDEMGHLGLACNMLRATGVQPKIFNGYDVIIYPGPLPGGVRPKCDPSFFPCDPKFQVFLGFADFHLFAEMCMQIEYPEDPVPRPRFLALEEELFPSIGQFYNAIMTTFQTLDGSFPYQTDKQLVNDNPEIFVIHGLATATDAISRIQKQGEGSSKFPFVDPAETILAHFYTFGEIFFGRKYVFNKEKHTGDWTGDIIPPPATYPMTPVPFGGYGAAAPTGVADCDKLFTKMLLQLDQAWMSGDNGALNNAIGTMFALKSAAITLLKRQVSRPEGGIYGPQFRKASL